ncbi:malate synthase A [Cognatilysobacter bugurensis]|uniref:malate synthase n=1 Tax=Cognatilysobacter bugurensis TaxID=543356 RepID=A0A918T325_9GAMM|nr:malate synthase A [Lysobacter bugurensis]GHA88330.1 malate synthase A [Lysobacter bugurensis]
MAAVLELDSDPQRGATLTAAQGAPGDLLSPAAMDFLAALHRTFEPVRQARLAARRERQAFFDAGHLPDFRSDTAAIREGGWRVAPLPEALLDRRVEITGPVDPKMVINALNSGAKVYMADFEDSTTPTWDNLVAGQQALRGAVAGTLTFDAPNGKHYALKPFDEQAVLMVRPRGWHLDEKHVLVDDVPMSGSLFDAGLFAFHNAHALAAKDRGPYLYLPKLQSMEEAQLWNDVLGFIERALGLNPGQIKVTVLIETLPAVFEMDEILHALRSRIAGLNCGRWDYMFSYLKTFRAHRDKALPERSQVTMTQPFLRAYTDLLVQTCHKRGAHAMGGMAAVIPVSGDEAATEAAFEKVRADKLREVQAGCDGTWVAHPALVSVARDVFDAHMPTPHQHHVTRDEVRVTQAELVTPPRGTITRAGLENNVEVCVRYLAAWLDGLGCVPIHGLMEDAATAEIARAQLWQWMHHTNPPTPDCPSGLCLDDGTPVDECLFEQALIGLPSRLAAQPNLPGSGRVNEAIELLDTLTRADTLEDFLTLPAYARLE